MGIKTAIEYCDSTTNPVPTCAGCELYSDDPAENHCYAASLVRRWGSAKGWPDDFRTYQFFDGRIERACFWPDLTGTKRPSKPWLDGMPRIIFLNDVGDSFSPIAPVDWALPHINMMEQSPHIWLWLTKWPWRMREFFNQVLDRVPKNFWLGTTITGLSSVAWRRFRSLISIVPGEGLTYWLSIEPMIAPVDIDELFKSFLGVDAKTGMERIRAVGDNLWVACGGESGSNRRPFDLSAARRLKDQCQNAGIPYFFKQVDKVRPIPDDLLIREMPAYADARRLF